jgi:preprotein translocase subunit Sec63
MEKDLTRNFYEVLEVPTNVASKELKLSYRTLSLRYHPDKHHYVSVFISFYFLNYTQKEC